MDSLKTKVLSELEAEIVSKNAKKPLSIIDRNKLVLEYINNKLPQKYIERNIRLRFQKVEFDMPVDQDKHSR